MKERLKKQENRVESWRFRMKWRGKKERCVTTKKIKKRNKKKEGTRKI